MFPLCCTFSLVLLRLLLVLHLRLLLVMEVMFFNVLTTVITTKFYFLGLPPPCTISFDHGIKVELKFLREPFQMSNVCNMVMFVRDMGSTVYCDATVSEVLKSTYFEEIKEYKPL